MKLDKFTVKSQEAVQVAVSLAEQFGNQEIQPEHLLKAVLEQPEGVAVPVLQKMGANPAAVLSETQQLIDKLPKVSGSGAGQVYPSANCSTRRSKRLRPCRTNTSARSICFLLSSKAATLPLRKCWSGLASRRTNFCKP